MTRMPIWTLVALVPLAAAARADIINVPADQPTIQAGIDAAVDGDEIVVAPGTYVETIDFMGEAIRLHSSDGPEVTTIDGDGAAPVVACQSGEGPQTVLEGFTITGGGGCIYVWGTPFCSSSGGMRNLGSSPTVTNCTFTGNMSSLGAGMVNHVSSPTVTGCRFLWNYVFSEFDASGGGMANHGSSNPIVANCTFIENGAGDGGGMYNEDGSSPTVTNCVFWANGPDEISGGAAVVTYSNVAGGWPGLGNSDECRSDKR